MNTPVHLLALAALGLVFVPGSAAAGSFTTNCESATDLDVSTDMEIALPADGRLCYASITIRTNKTLTFTRNALNTPVYLFAQGDVVFEDGAVIDVSGGDGRNNGLFGRGGPGGFDAAAREIDPSQIGGPGHGPGAGSPGALTGSWGGNASYGGLGNANPNYGPVGAIYGSQLLMPLVGGSGGAAGNTYGGGGGGGAILIASDTRIVMMTSLTWVIARGGINAGSDTGSGSGGAIRLVAPTVEGSGQLSVRTKYANNLGVGRARIDTLFNDNLNITTEPAAAPFTIGSVMLTFLDIEPRLDIIGVGQTSGGEFIDVDHPEEKVVLIPTGSGATHDISVQLTDFTASVPITVKLIPSVGDYCFFTDPDPDPCTYETTVDMSTGVVDGSKTVDVPVTFPLNVATFVQAWTRPPSGQTTP